MTIEQKRREIFDTYWTKIHSSGHHCRWDAWLAFNAALDAVLIELPEKFGDNHGGDSHGPGMYDQSVQDCTDAIESTGLGLKVLP